MNTSGAPPPSAALFAALLGPPLIALLAGQLDGRLPTAVALQILYLALVAFVVIVGPLRVRRPDWTTIATAVLLILLALYVLPLIAPPVTAPVRDAMHRLALQPLWFRIVLAATGGISEEILYRGYALERVAALTGRMWIGATISALAFGLAHVPVWGWKYALAADLPFGIVMTVVYVWRRDLIANAAAHSIALVAAILTVS